MAKTLYRALRIHIERVETMAASHEKTVSLATTKAKIGAPLGQRDAADRLAFGIEDHHPIVPRLRPCFAVGRLAAVERSFD